MNKKILSPTCLIIGGNGIIGSSLFEYLNLKKHVVYATTRRNCQPPPGWIYYDLASNKPLSGCHNITHAFLCAGQTNIALCNQNPEKSYEVNVTNTVKLAKVLHKNATKIIYLSSSAVFDGQKNNPTEDTPYSCSTEYGFQKTETEKQLLSLGDGVCIVRLTKIVHNKIPIFKNIMDSLLSHKPCPVFSDLFISPLSVNYVACVLEKIVTEEKSGIFHLSGDNQLSYTDLALLITKKLNLPTSLVIPTLSKGLLHKPTYSRLGMRRTQKMLNINPQSIEEVISEFLTSYRDTQ